MALITTTSQHSPIYALHVERNINITTVNTMRQTNYRVHMCFHVNFKPLITTCRTVRRRFNAHSRTPRRDTNRRSVCYAISSINELHNNDSYLPLPLPLRVSVLSSAPSSSPCFAPYLVARLLSYTVLHMHKEHIANLMLSRRFHALNRPACNDVRPRRVKGLVISIM